MVLAVNKKTEFYAKLKILLDGGDLLEARRQCMKYVRKHGSDQAVRMELGIINAKLGFYDQAIESFERLLKINPANADAAYNMAKSYEIQGQQDEAISYYEKAVDADPTHRQAWFGLASVSRDHGEFEKAACYCREAIVRWPAYGKPYHILSAVRSFAQENDDDVRLMQAALDLPELSGDDRACVNYALSKVYDDLADYGRSFKHLKLASDEVRRTIKYDVNEDERLFAAIKKVFSREFFTQHGLTEGRGKGVIFILGMPRSGTTLVEQVLSSHSKVVARGELQFLRAAVWGVNAKMVNTSFPANVLSLDADDLDKMAEYYLEKAGVERGAIFTDKLPSNFILIGMIRLLFPEAKVIHCRRDPVDTCLACYRQFFVGSLSFSFTLEEVGRYYLAYEDLMRHWADVLPGFIWDVQYEELVQDLRGVSERLLEYCGLDWEEACMRFYESKRSVQTASVVQVRQPIYNTSVEKWRNYAPYIGPLLDILGGRKRAKN